MVHDIPPEIITSQPRLHLHLFLLKDPYRGSLFLDHSIFFLSVSLGPWWKNSSPATRTLECKSLKGRRTLGVVLSMDRWMDVVVRE